MSAANRKAAARRARAKRKKVKPMPTREVFGAKSGTKGKRKS